MVERQKPRTLNGKRSRWFWVVTGVLSVAVAAAFFADSTLTVQADTPLARPAATLPPGAPTPNFTTEAKRPAKHDFAAQALSGIATWYGSVLDGHRTASGERFNMMAMTAAHKSLPFGTVVRVVNLKTKRSVVVRVNDRGELPDNHVIDLSYGAARELQILKSGVAPVKLEVIAQGTGKR